VRLRAVIERMQELARVGKRPSSMPLLVVYCLYAALQAFKPSEAFFVEYLLSKGIPGLETSREVSRSVMSVYSFSMAPALLVCLALCRVVGCKGVIVLGTFCSVLTTLVTLEARALWLIQLSQVSVAFSFSSFIAFEALQFHGTTATRASYQVVSHCVKAVTLASWSTSSVLGQLLQGRIGNAWLFRITFGCGVCAGVVSLLLPFERDEDGEGGSFDRSSSRPLLMPSSPTHQGSGEAEATRRPSGPLATKAGGALSDFWMVVQSLKRPCILKWTLWWAFSYAIHDLVVADWQILAHVKWTKAAADRGLPLGHSRNGYVWSAAYLVSSLSTLATCRWRMLHKYVDLILAVIPGLMGACLVLMGKGPLVVFYGAFVAYQGLFELSGAVRNASVAREIALVGEYGGVDAAQACERRWQSRTFLTSCVLLFAALLAMVFEAVIQTAVQYAISSSFVDSGVWVGMGVLLWALGFAFSIALAHGRWKHTQRLASRESKP